MSGLIEQFLIEATTQEVSVHAVVETPNGLAVAVTQVRISRPAPVEEVVRALRSMAELLEREGRGQQLIDGPIQESDWTMAAAAIYEAVPEGEDDEGN
jgi:hypothetical protein